MYVGNDFSPIDIEEKIDLAFDFVNDLVSGENITAVEWEIATLEGIDLTPESHFVDTPSVSGTVVAQRLTNFTVEARYRILARVTTDRGNELSLWSHFNTYKPD